MSSRMGSVAVLIFISISISLCKALSYPSPVYGTKRYGRSATNFQSHDSYPYPLNYYKPYPYSQPTYPEEYYYPQEAYPAYYPAPRTSKYEVYQAVMPYYYQERPLTRPTYYGYKDPMTGLQEEMIQEAEREQRQEAEPIGHESFYENDDGAGDEESLDMVNAAFLQNLILAQMYQNQIMPDTKDPYNYDQDYDNYEEKYEEYKPKPNHNTEDEDVRELKQLSRQQNRLPSQKYRQQDKNGGNDIHWFQESNFNKQRKNKKHIIKEKRSDDVDYKNNNIVYEDSKSVEKLGVALTSEAPSTSTENGRDQRGQKEEFQMRPATPVKHPFSSPVVQMMAKNNLEKKRTPSVYDTIRHMLDMERSLENAQSPNSEVRPAMRKRIITPEESLTRQLTVLKKTQ